MPTYLAPSELVEPSPFPTSSSNGCGRAGHVEPSWNPSDRPRPSALGAKSSSMPAWPGDLASLVVSGPATHPQAIPRVMRCALRLGYPGGDGCEIIEEPLR
jgi:hypothetical protein